MNLSAVIKELSVNSHNVHDLEMRLSGLEYESPEWDRLMPKLIEGREYQKQLRKRRAKLEAMKRRRA